MGTRDGCVMILRGTRGRLGYVIDSKGPWLTMAVDLASCLIYCRILSVQFGDAFVGSLHDNVSGRSVG